MAAPTVTWEFPERPRPDGAIARSWSRPACSRRPSSRRSPRATSSGAITSGPQAAAHIIREHRPNLMMFHLLNLDSTQHRYGPRTPAAMTTMAHLDAQVAEIVAAVEQAGLTSRTTFFIVSDHGFKLVKRQIRLNAAFMKAGLLKAQDGKIVSVGGLCRARGRLGHRLSDVARPDRRAAGAGAKGDCRRRGDRRGDRAGRTTPRTACRSRADNNQMGVLFVTPKDGLCVHGRGRRRRRRRCDRRQPGRARLCRVRDPDLSALFIASGAGIKRRREARRDRQLDVAPTMAEILGLSWRRLTGGAEGDSGAT